MTGPSRLLPHDPGPFDRWLGDLAFGAILLFVLLVLSLLMWSTATATFLW